MRVIETKAYKLEEHPNKENVFNWIRNNWFDLNEHSTFEIVDSLKILQKKIGGRIDYCISQVPDRGEFISFSGYDKELLSELKADDCSLTGVCWDIDIIEGLKNGEIENVLTSLHNETEYIYSDEGLTELCEANEYEFTEDGSII